MTELKNARDMTPEEAEATLAQLRRGPKPEPMPVDKLAKDMSEAEREEWLREHIRRCGVGQ